MNAGAVLSRLSHVRQTGPGQWQACCPAHEDRTPSLSIAETPDRLLLHCYAGCSVNAIAAAVGLTVRDLFADRVPGNGGAAEGLSLVAYCQAKRLTPCRLAAAGVREVVGRDGRPYLAIAYRDAGGQEVATRFRFHLAGAGRFKWRRRTKARGLLYGLETLTHARAAGHVTLWEGESDVHACWEHDVPALGIPGVENCDPARLAADLAGIGAVYLNREPGHAPAALLRAVAAAPGIVDRVRVLDLTPHKDASELHCADPEGFVSALRAAMEAARPLAEVVAELTPPAEQRGAGRKPAGRFALSDLGNAERLVATHGAELRFNVTSGQWLRWTGRVWERDETGEVHRLAGGTMRGMLREAAELPDLQAQAELARHALKSEAAPRLGAAIELARWRPGVPVRATELDADPWLLNCQNGLLDLRTGSVRRHAPEGLCAKVAGTEYDPEAECPRWERFLAEVFPEDPDLPGYLQLVAGYLLTGRTGEQECYFLVGKGANGKGVLLDTLFRILGDYAMDTPFSTFLESRDSATNDLAGLVGARLVGASEGSARETFNEGLLKRVTGGDPITCRYLYRDFFSYWATFKVVFATNEVPRFMSQAYAIRRRVRLVRFRQTFYPPDDGRRPVRESGLRAALREELPGVLAWAVRGCLRWQREGMSVPASVGEASRDLFESTDPLGDFLSECCAFGAGLEVGTGELYRAYVARCKDEGRPAAFKRQDSFTRSVGQRDGVEWKHRNHGGVLVGVGLRLDSGL